MRKQLGIGAVVVGGVGVLLCATTVGIGWWAAARTAACLERVAARLAVRLTRELGALAREAITGSELLAEGIAAARQEIVVVR